MSNDLYAWKKFIRIGLIGILPLMLIFVFFKAMPDNPALYYFLELTKNVSTNISSTNLELTKPLGMYCKLAPLFSIYFSVSYLKYLKSSPKTEDKASLIFYSLGFLAVYVVLFYIFLISSFDINNGNRLLQITTSNDFYILFYYLTVFSGFYALTFVLTMLVKLIYSELVK
ncbi:hypothetical protein SME38J_13640 [Serratia marcescens]|nr:hypothetical protein SME38J_13640 [Serratia marcescens]